MSQSLRRWPVVLLGLMVLQGCTPAEPDTAGVTLIFGGTILTMDQERPEAEAVVVREDRIEALGNQADLEVLFPNARRHDLQGHTLLPGFVDSHTHVHELGHDRSKADLHGVETVEAMVERLRARYPDPEPGQWLVGAGWDEGQWGTRGYPDRADLDAAFPDNPVALESLHGFAGFYNGPALAAAGVDAETPDPEGGVILRRADGEPTGVMLTLAQGLVTRYIPPETLDEAKAAIVVGLEALAEVGVTSVHEAGMDPLILQAFAELAMAGRLPIRVYGLLDGNNDSLMTAWFSQGPLVDPTAFFTVRSIKVFYDGSLGSRTALLRQPYSDDPRAANPLERITPEAMASLAERAARHGFQMAVHAIGDEGNDRTRKTLEGQPPDGWYADQALTVDEALRAMISLGAYAAFQDDQLGMLAPGYFADFVELDRDPRRVAPDSLKDLKVMRTWVAGQVIATADGR